MVCTEERSRIAGGFVLVEVVGLMRTWRLCQSRPLGVGDFRGWLALREMKARRCSTGQGRTPNYTVAELARLTGVSERRASASVKRLVVAGLVVVDAEQIEFPVDVLEDDEQLADTIGRGRGSVAIPRRMLRFLADGARPAMIATVLGTLLRCLSRRRTGFDGRGRVKASWIARTFDVDVRRVKAARAELIDLGWVKPEPSDQRIENRYGRAFRIDLDWVRIPSRSLPPLGSEIGRGNATPRVNLDPLRENENQKPAELGPTGFCQQEVDRQNVGIQIPQNEVFDSEPTLADVKAADLRDTGRMLELHRQAVERNLVNSSEADRLKFVAVAEHARAIGHANPPGLFARLVARGWWHFTTQADEDAARRRLKAHLWPAPVALPLVTSGNVARPKLSEDARIVREVRRSLEAVGYRGDPFPQLRRIDPSWTRARWDSATSMLSTRADQIAGQRF